MRAYRKDSLTAGARTRKDEIGETIYNKSNNGYSVYVKKYIDEIQVFGQLGSTHYRTVKTFGVNQEREAIDYADRLASLSYDEFYDAVLGGKNFDSARKDGLSAGSRTGGRLREV